jgi:hypothetical protein
MWREIALEHGPYREGTRRSACQEPPRLLRGLCFHCHSNNYGRTLMSAPPQAVAPNPHTNLLNVYIQIANKMGFQQQQKSSQKHATTLRPV